MTPVPVRRRAGPPDARAGAVVIGDENTVSLARHNTQLFALPAAPPAEIAIGGATYRLRRVFKHDFYAATTLYEACVPTGAAAGTPASPDITRIVVKIYRTQAFAGLPLSWLGRLSRDHEAGIYAALDGVDGVPRWVGMIGPTGLAIEYIDAVPLDHLDHPPAGYFDRMRAILDAVHRRGVAYVDANKRSNMLVGADGSAHLIDFQIAIRQRDDWPWPLRWLARRVVRYCQDKDLYHLYKQKRRLAPEELTEQERRLSRQRSGWHAVHRKLTKPYRAVRRWFLGSQHRAGRLISPTADLEDHDQPEKQTWRGPPREDTR